MTRAAGQVFQPDTSPVRLESLRISRQAGKPDLRGSTQAAIEKDPGK